MIYIAFFPCWSDNLDCRHMKAVNKTALIKVTFNLLARLLELNKFLWNCIFCTNVEATEQGMLLYLNSVGKNDVFSILHLFQVQQVQKNVCNLISFCLLFFFKHKALYKQNFLKSTFQVKIWRLSVGRFIEIIEGCLLYALNYCARNL